MESKAFTYCNFCIVKNKTLRNAFEIIKHSLLGFKK